MRTINSPGIQLTEIDLSNYAQPTVGTNIFIAGFSSKGPIDEVSQITSMTELEEVYGKPSNTAEAYFYESCKQIVRSPGNLYCTRLPYGAGNGEGFANQYSALLFPATTAVEVTFTAVSTVNVQTIKIVGDEGIEGVDFNAGIATSSYTITQQFIKEAQQDFSYTAESTKTVKENNTNVQYLSLSTVTTNYQAVQGKVKLDIGEPRQITLSMSEYNDILNESFEWDSSVKNTNSFVEPQFLTYGVPTMQDVGFIVLNTSKSTNNEKAEGYYIAIADNANFGPDNVYDSIVGVKGLSANNGSLKDELDASLPVTYGQVEIPVSRFITALSSVSGDRTTSVSQILETVPKFDFSSPYYNDSVVFSVMRVAPSNYQPSKLNISVVETYIGSFDKDKKTIADSGGVQRTFYIADVVNKYSSRVRMLINPYISRDLSWVNQEESSGNPQLTVRVADEAKYMYANGVFASKAAANNQDVGNVNAKLEHALRLVENVDAYTLDIVCDAGLSTIYANKDSAGVYYDLQRLDAAQTTFTDGSDVVQSWREVYNTLETFVGSTRKDCMAIVDPLRQVFLRGNAKTADIRGASFTSQIYAPLKTLTSASDNNYVAVYGNWGACYNASLDRQVWIPLSGPIAAVYAKSDAVSQPWYAPAGFNRGDLAMITDLAVNPTQKQRDNLYTIAVNPVVHFPGEGFIVYGQKTLQKKPTAFDRVNVRRLFLALERSTLQALKYFVFEPNTVITRTRLLNTIGPIFSEAKRTQGVYDYLIVCDERNNTPDSIDRNELIVDIYLKPVKAAEFILVNFIATRTGQDFSELI